MNERLVYKYPLDLRDGSQGVWLPGGAIFLKAVVQDHRIAMWFEFMKANQFFTKCRNFRIVATGEEFDFVGDHRDTVTDGTYVWHVYEVL